jgi:hypothetical protein
MISGGRSGLTVLITSILSAFSGVLERLAGLGFRALSDYSRGCRLCLPSKQAKKSVHAAQAPHRSDLPDLLTKSTRVAIGRQQPRLRSGEMAEWPKAPDC